MASKLLPDELWNEIEPLFPQYEASPEGGWPPKEARNGADGNSVCAKDRHRLERLAHRSLRLFVQDLSCDGSTSGRSWVCGNGCTSCSWPKLRGADLLDWSRVLVDCSLVKAPLGGPKQGRIRRIAAARAVSTAC